MGKRNFPEVLSHSGDPLVHPCFKSQRPHSEIQVNPGLESPISTIESQTDLSLQGVWPWSTTNRLKWDRWHGRPWIRYTWHQCHGWNRGWEWPYSWNPYQRLVHEMICKVHCNQESSKALYYIVLTSLSRVSGQNTIFGWCSCGRCNISWTCHTGLPDMELLIHWANGGQDWRKMISRELGWRNDVKIWGRRPWEGVRESKCRVSVTERSMGQSMN